MPNMKALSAVNPYSELIPVGRMNGVTSADHPPRRAGSSPDSVR
jgi:hypothetical protein